MANARIGSHPSHGYQLAETIDTTGKQLGWNDSGKLFFCVQNATADVLVYLPKLSTEIAGWHAKFILKTTAANDFGIVAYGSSATVGVGATDGDSDSIVFMEFPSGDDGGAGTMDADSDLIYFKASVSEAGNVIEMHTDGTKWYAQAWTRTPADVDDVS